MSTTTLQPYSIREVDLSDLSLLKKVQHAETNDSLLRMPFLLLAQHDSIAAFSSAAISKNNHLTIEMCYNNGISENLSEVFKQKAQTYFEQQLLTMFGDEESLKRGIRQFHDWVNPNGNSKLA